MEFLKTRKESKLLRVYRAVNARMVLTDAERQYLDSLEKGFKGELLFDQRLAALTIPGLVNADLLLEVNQSTVQMDSFVCIPGTDYLFEIKNMEGDYSVDAKGDWYTTSSKTPVKNPILQVARMETLLRQYFKNNGLQYTVGAYIIFINPHFTLYNVPQQPQLVLPSQFDRFMTKLETASRSKTYSHQQRRMLEYFRRDHCQDPPLKNPPNYTYEQLKKGFVCGSCQKRDVEVGNGVVVCRRCFAIERLTSAVSRNVRELNLLFPDKKITTASVVDWCGWSGSPRVITNILNELFNGKGKTKQRHYTINDEK